MNRNFHAVKLQNTKKVGTGLNCAKTKLHEVTKLHEGTILHKANFLPKVNFARVTILHDRSFFHKKKKQKKYIQKM